jgi:hypothetical protein
MATYEVEVIETRAVKVIYTVEADTAQEAEDCGVIGDTVNEQEIPSSVEVINRVVYSSPIQVD